VSGEVGGATMASQVPTIGWLADDASCARAAYATRDERALPMLAAPSPASAERREITRLAEVCVRRLDGEEEWLIGTPFR
jgi:hypothetical protein